MRINELVKEVTYLLSILDLKSVDLFLKTCEKEINKGNSYFVDFRTLSINGKKISAKQALIDIGIMKEKQIWDFFLNLNIIYFFKVDFDYDTSRDMNSEIYVFIKELKGKDIYIKLTMNEKGIICLSFHESY